MKDSKKYSEAVEKHFESLRKKYKEPEKARYDEPVDALVYGVLCETMNEKDADQALEKIKEHFADFNDLRVSRTEETTEVLDHVEKGRAKNAATKLNMSLQAVFSKYNMLSLKPILKSGIRAAKQTLEDIEGITHFEVNYVILTAVDGHAIPLTGWMIDYLKENELVHPDADKDDIEGFLLRLISADDIYQFYITLRRASESSQRGRKKSTSKSNSGSKSESKSSKKTKKTKKKKKTKKSKSKKSS